MRSRLGLERFMVKRLEAQVKRSKTDITRFPADKFLDQDGDELIAAVKVAEAALALENYIAVEGGVGQFVLQGEYQAVLEEYQELKEKK